MLNANEIKELKQAIYYLNMGELKKACDTLKLPNNGTKGEIIHRIATYIETGQIVGTLPLPDISKAKKGMSYPLSPNTFILHGNYKNDLKTRNFMKSLIGEHFHFTAYGIDWIKDAWVNANPPTYAEFAKFWQEEHTLRKSKKAEPKQEWAYLSYIQAYLQHNPQAKKKQILENWEKERKLNVNKVQEILKKYVV
jgi:hypothetical protein